jgi:hypothetical protein
MHRPVSKSHRSNPELTGRIRRRIGRVQTLIGPPQNGSRQFPTRLGHNGSRLGRLQSRTGELQNAIGRFRGGTAEFDIETPSVEADPIELKVTAARSGLSVSRFKDSPATSGWKRPTRRSFRPVPNSFWPTPSLLRPITKSFGPARTHWCRSEVLTVESESLLVHWMLFRITPEEDIVSGSPSGKRCQMSWFSAAANLFCSNSLINRTNAAAGCPECLLLQPVGCVPETQT